MKLTLYRQSGLPVKLESLKAYETDWKEVYDKATERAKLDMLKLNRMLRFLERQLIKKHGSEVVLDVPQTNEAWNALIKSYEDTPIMIAKRTDKEEVVAILMDTFQ